ncbi:hypothetical protein CI610_03614 [invertebrate metagenome]|uniref:Uncharacterized protein n=1 Tax=invertebrate metagenome TaxID=1711999 RepID=A0A2H9T2M1_9ZZZZ
MTLLSVTADERDSFSISSLVNTKGDEKAAFPYIDTMHPTAQGSTFLIKRGFSVFIIASPWQSKSISYLFKNTQPSIFILFIELLIKRYIPYSKKNRADSE